METQTPTAEGHGPTPPGMAPQDSAPKADPVVTQPEAKPAELKVIEDALGREFSSLDDAKNTLKHLNSLVGDQTLSKQRKAVEKIASQANVSTDELYEILEQSPLETPEAPEPAIQPTMASNESKRLTRLEVDEVVKNDPDASAIRDTLFAKSLASGVPAQEIWEREYKPLVEVGRKNGAKKLQSHLEGQPLPAHSTVSETSDTKIDFSGINPATGKRWTAKEMEQFLQYQTPSQGL